MANLIDVCTTNAGKAYRCDNGEYYRRDAYGLTKLMTSVHNNSQYWVSVSARDMIALARLSFELVESEAKV